MSLSPRNFFGLVDDSNPKGSDPGSLLDNQDREILGSLKQQFPNLNSVVNATPAQLNWTGYGGLKADSPKSISPATTIPTAPAIIINDLYDSISCATPVGVTQDLTGGILILDAGTWHVSASVAARAVASGTNNNRGIDGRVRVASGASFPIRITSSIQADQTFFSANASGIIELASQTSIEIAISALGANVTVDYLDGLNFQATRIAL